MKTASSERLGSGKGMDVGLTAASALVSDEAKKQVGFLLAPYRQVANPAEYIPLLVA